jgi:hypothetical protein
MRQPSRRGTAFSRERYAGWLESFPGYRHAITDDDVANWLEQFHEAHRDIAARVLDAVEYITSDATTLAYRNLLTALPGWHGDQNQRKGTWKFVPFSLSEGESGNAMMHIFRNANHLAGRQHNSLFVNWSQLASLGRDDTVVFIDDFSGSGNQVAEYWPTFEEILANGPTVYLLLVAATTTAQTKISEETSFDLRAERFFDASDNIFASACKHFTNAEKDTLLTYCQQASTSQPKGYGSCGLLVVLAHKAPNNSIPVLHNVNSHWNGLFRRHG